MRSLFSWSLTSTALLAFGLTGTTVTSIITPAPASAQVTAQTPEQTPVPVQTPVPNQTPGRNQTPTTTPAAVNFPDVSPDFWAYEFIQALAARNIITGFPDGTFRPEQPVQRAEFAAMIQKAFEQNRIRQLPPGGFKDVPGDYWAASAIQEAYETGFMAGYPNNLFLPNQQIPKVQAIAALANGLNLTPTGTAQEILSTNYADAGQIPSYAVNQVAAATQANLVVNYPDVRTLNPDTALTRAEAAAHLYQALVRQGQLPPLPSNVAAANYIVGGTTTPTQPTNDIVSLVGSSNSFTTLTSLLKTAGLADVLQQPGPYTIFAPPDQAFAALPAETLQQLQQPENRETLIRLLRYHVVPGQVTASELSAGELKTLADNAVNVQIDPAKNQIAINDAEVIQPNVQASNGVIHVVNEVLIPPNLQLGQQPTDQNGDIEPGRATRGGRSYVGVAGNIGLTGGGGSGVGQGNFAVISKLGLTNTISVRPSVVFGDDVSILVPLTWDFAGRSVSPVGEQQFTVSPYIGAGAAFETSDDADIGFLLTGGIDVPLGNRFTATGSVNAVFGDDTDVGILLGVGYNF